LLLLGLVAPQIFYPLSLLSLMSSWSCPSVPALRDVWVRAASFRKLFICFLVMLVVLLARFRLAFSLSLVVA